MEFTARISMDNAAFDDCPGSELARILREIARQVERGESEISREVTDINGNHVGRFTIAKREG
jgi:hypothetical protein